MSSCNETRVEKVEDSGMAQLNNIWILEPTKKPN
jgi:hypothetical protein